jgi:hypothetical protein
LLARRGEPLLCHAGIFRIELDPDCAAAKLGRHKANGAGAEEGV